MSIVNGIQQSKKAHITIKQHTCFQQTPQSNRSPRVSFLSHISPSARIRSRSIGCCASRNGSINSPNSVARSHTAPETASHASPRRTRRHSLEPVLPQPPLRIPAVHRPPRNCHRQLHRVLSSLQAPKFPHSVTGCARNPSDSRRPITASTSPRNRGNGDKIASTSTDRIGRGNFAEFSSSADERTVSPTQNLRERNTSATTGDAAGRFARRRWRGDGGSDRRLRGSRESPRFPSRSRARGFHG